jgi:hypothetical protein
MLTFLSIACRQKFVLDSYEDEVVGHMEKNADGKLAITRVEPRPIGPILSLSLYIENSRSRLRFETGSMTGW